MTLRTIKLSAVAVVLFVLFIAPGVAQTPDRAQICQPPWEYTGCWRNSPGDACLDRWRDGSGRQWLISPCGVMVEPRCGGIRANPLGTSCN